MEAFDTDTADVTDGSYPDFTLNVGTAIVSGGVLQLGGGSFVQRFTRDGFGGNLIISGQIQAASFGDWNVGMEFGNRRFIFHPGFTGGAFRIEDASLGSLGILVGSLDMGFTPSPTSFHTMELEWNLSLNQLTVTVEDGDDIADPFVVLWTPDLGFDATGRIGFTYHDGGGAGPGIGFFDNLTIVPEPATAPLVGLGFVALAVGRRGAR